MEICGLLLAIKILPTPPLLDDACNGLVSAGARLTGIVAFGERKFMAERADNKEQKMDERSGNTNNTGSEENPETRVSRKTPRGFAAMNPEAQRAIAAKGGRAAHQKGTAHEFTSEEARIAGRKGGEASRGGRRSTGNSDSTNDNR
jgi:general stress protein YciG